MRSRRRCPLSKLANSYAADLLKLKGGRNEIATALLVGLVAAMLVTGILVQMSFPDGLAGWTKMLRSHLYWHEYKNMTHAQSVALPLAERVEFLEFLVRWKSHDSLWSLYKWTAIGTQVAVVVAWAFIRQRFASKTKLSEQLRDGEHTLVTSKALQKLICGAVKDKSRPHTFRKHDIVLGKEQVRVCDETIGLHLGLGGASQTGKTNAINHLVASRRDAGEKVLIVDPNGEFFARFGRKGDTILSLHDARAAQWDFWSERVSEEEIAKALVEVRDGMDANTKFFQTTGRAVLTSLLRIARKAPERLRELWRLANLSAEDLESILKANNEISHRYLGQGDSGQASGVIATSLMNLEFLKYLNHHASTREASKGPERSFSIRSWVLDESDSRWVFLVASDSHWEQTRPLIRLWFDIASTSILERVQRGPEELKPLWLVCDEISTVGLLPSLPKVLDRGYKYRGRLVLGFQSLAQIKQIYGPDASANIMQGLQNLLIFACNETLLAREFSDRLGRSEVEEYEPNVSPAEGKNPMRLSFATRQKEKAAVTADEIRSLPENVAYLKLARLPPTKLHFPYVQFSDSGVRSADFSSVPERTWLDPELLPPPVAASPLGAKERGATAVAPSEAKAPLAEKPSEVAASERPATETGRSPSSSLAPSRSQWL